MNLFPWNIPLSERINEMIRAKKAGFKLAFYLSKTTNEASFRYRVYNIYQRLKKSEKWKAFYFCESETEIAQEYLDNADIFVIHRYGWNFKLDEICHRVKNSGITVSCDIDDLVYDLDNAPALLATLNVKENAHGSHLQMMARKYMFMTKGDSFITTNGYLAAQIENKFKRRAHVIPNSLNDEQIYASQNTQKEKNDGFILGYFSGSPTHYNDFSSISPEIADFLECHGDAKVLLAGYANPPQSVNKFAKSGQILMENFTDFQNLQNLIAKADVNLIPLVDNIFTNCKSELKFFEAAAVKVPSIAAPRYVYEKCIKNGENGFLCKQGQWFDVLETLYQDKKSGGKYSLSVGLKAKEYVLEHYYGGKILKTIEDTFDAVFKG